MSDAQDRDRHLTRAVIELLEAKHISVGYIGAEVDIQAVILDVEKIRTKLAEAGKLKAQLRREVEDASK